MTTRQDKIDRVLALSNQEEILRAVEHFKPKNMSSIKSRSGKRILVNLRKVYCILAQRAGYHLREMGWFLGGRDHTTILHNIVHGKHHLECEEAFQELFNKVQSHLLELYENRLNDNRDEELQDGIEALETMKI